MKKLLLTLAIFLSGCWFAAAQDVPRVSESQETLDDKMQQQPPRPEQRSIERQVKTTAERQQTEKEIIEQEKKQQSLEKVKEKTKTIERRKTTEKPASSKN